MLVLLGVQGDYLISLSAVSQGGNHVFTGGLCQLSAAGLQRFPLPGVRRV